MPIYWLNEGRDLERERDQASIPASFADSTHRRLAAAKRAGGARYATRVRPKWPKRGGHFYPAQ
jgi:hypothetical protein